MMYSCFCYNACMLQKMCSSAPWGHTFRWVAEFGVTPALPVPAEPQLGAAPQSAPERDVAYMRVEDPDRFLDGLTGLWRGALPLLASIPAPLVEHNLLLGCGALDCCGFCVWKAKKATNWP